MTDADPGALRGYWQTHSPRIEEMLTRQGQSPISCPRVLGIGCIGTVACREIHGSYAEYTWASLDNARPVTSATHLAIVPARRSARHAADESKAPSPRAWTCSAESPC